MAPNSWLSRLKAAVSPTPALHHKPRRLEILAFEVSAVMSKLLSLSSSLSDPSLSHLWPSLSSPAAFALVSPDPSLLLSLAAAEVADSLRLAADSLSPLTHRCSDPALLSFPAAFKDFAASGRDPHRWAVPWPDLAFRSRKMSRLVCLTADLLKSLDDLADAEHSLRKSVQFGADSIRSMSIDEIAAVGKAQQRVLRLRQEVKHLKQVSLWGCTYDAAIALTVRLCFAVLARIRHVFGLGSSSAAAVAPDIVGSEGLFEWSKKMMSPAATTVGAAGLAARYADVVMAIDRMTRAPGEIGREERDELYSILPRGVQALVRERLKGVAGPAVNSELAGEWREAMGRVMALVGPMAEDTVKWQAERWSLERRRRCNVARDVGPAVMMWQTLCFADKEKVEAAITELLVGLNYLCRFEKEMTARTMMQQF